MSTVSAPNHATHSIRNKQPGATGWAAILVSRYMTAMPVQPEIYVGEWMHSLGISSFQLDLATTACLRLSGFSQASIWHGICCAVQCVWSFLNVATLCVAVQVYLPCTLPNYITCTRSVCPIVYAVLHQWRTHTVWFCSQQYKNLVLSIYRHVNAGDANEVPPRYV